ncbi:MAG: hypothetical protein FWG08_05060 [Propionibacteriaceae bacterium]|nr:hypothetical protein [Propionibacteriaceae bacterium]
MKHYFNTIVRFCAHAFRAFVRRQPGPVATPSTAETDRVSQSATENRWRAAITFHAPSKPLHPYVQTLIFGAGSAEPNITVTTVSRTQTAQEIGGIVLDEFGRLHSQCRDDGIVGDIYVGYHRVRKMLMSAQGSFPAVKLLENLTLDEASIVYGDRTALLTSLQSSELLDQPLPRLVVATDGSAALHGRKGIGWAFVAADGRYAIGNSRTGNNPTEAELRAIDLVLSTVRGPLDIYTDCQVAIKWINNPGSAPNKRCTEYATKIRQMLATSQSELFWVKGHAGHPLNDKADRLARIARLELSGVYRGSTESVAQSVIHDDALVPVE